jgi:hypothetical protein
MARLCPQRCGPVCTFLALGSIIEGFEERGATRRLTWALIHDPETMCLLSDLLGRRDAYVASLRE